MIAGLPEASAQRFAPGMPESLLAHDAWIVLCEVQARFTLFFSLGRIPQ
jgi:hypothetical protein